jgi:sporulation protein YlmC with PRC-barrel domain
LATRTLLGVPVTTADGVQLGQLSDVLIDPTEGRVVMGIVAAGGWFGLGTRFTALPWPMLRPVMNGMSVVVVLGPVSPHLSTHHGTSEAVPLP